MGFDRETLIAAAKVAVKSTLDFVVGPPHADGSKNGHPNDVRREMEDFRLSLTPPDQAAREFLQTAPVEDLIKKIGRAVELLEPQANMIDRIEGDNLSINAGESPTTRSAHVDPEMRSEDIISAIRQTPHLIRARAASNDVIVKDIKQIHEATAAHLENITSTARGESVSASDLEKANPEMRDRNTKKELTFEDKMNLMSNTLAFAPISAAPENREAMLEGAQAVKELARALNEHGLEPHQLEARQQNTQEHASVGARPAKKNRDR